MCNKISIHRSIEDKRSIECKTRPVPRGLPSTSVIIVFHNEARCTLLRTVYSILHTTPRTLLKEIILVDDKSELEKRPELGDELVEYLDTHFDGLVKLARQPKREGLIQARLAGAEIAKENGPKVASISVKFDQT